MLGGRRGRQRCDNKAVYVNAMALTFQGGCWKYFLAKLRIKTLLYEGPIILFSVFDKHCSECHYQPLIGALKDLTLAALAWGCAAAKASDKFNKFVSFLSHRLSGRHHHIPAKMESYRHAGYPQEGVMNLPEERYAGAPNTATLPYPNPVEPASYDASASAFPDQMSSAQKPLEEAGPAAKYSQSLPGNLFTQRPKKLNKKWQQRLYW